jgi:hypothetical protein
MPDEMMPPRDPKYLASMVLASILKEHGPLDWRELHKKAAAVRVDVFQDAVICALEAGLIEATFSHKKEI